MNQVKSTKTKNILLSTVIAVLSFFIFGLFSNVRAEIIEYNDYDTEPFTLTSEYDGRAWPVGQLLNGAPMRGILSFDVTGLKNEESIPSKKRQIFGMVDEAQPSLWDNAGYFMHLRKRSYSPGSDFTSSDLIQIKGRINCEWFGNEHIQVPDWVEDHLYHFTITWTSGVTDKAATVKMEDRSLPQDDEGNYPSWEGSAPLPWPWLAQDTLIAFGQGGLASFAAAFPSEPGATYNNIILNAETVAPDYDDFGGYPACDEPIDIDNGNREDQPGTDMGDPYDDPNNPYDTCACTSLTGGEPPCKDPDQKDDGINLAQTPFGFYVDCCDLGEVPPFDIGLKVNWTLGDIINEIIDLEKIDRPEPALDISFAPPAATTGDLLNMSVVPQNFRTMPRNMMFNWCLTRGDNGQTKSYNERIASGDGPVAETVGNNTWQNNGCCDPLTRTPANNSDTDTDNDGMGDNWERRYFIGRTINGVEATADNVLTLVSPDQDYDNDGFLAGRFQNQGGEYMTLTPSLQDYLGQSFYPGADSLLTNVEEYILGTNPTDGDTDNDGYGDEMDYLGTGAMTFAYTIDIAPGPGSYGYLVTVSALGINQVNLVGITARSRQYNVSEGDKLQVTLASDKNFIAPTASFGQSSLTLTTSVAASDVNREDLLYQWSFNGENICETEAFSQFCNAGRYKITIGPDSDTSLLDLPGFDGDLDNIEFGTEYIFTVTATDSKSRRIATADLSVPVVSSLDLTTACADGEEDLESLPANTEEPVSLCIQQVLDSTDIDVAGSNFQWYNDGLIDQDQSGIGQSSYQIETPGSPGDTKTIAVQVIQPDTGGILGSGERQYLVYGPIVAIVEPEPQPMSVGIGSNAMMVSGLPGETVNFVVETDNFPSSAVLNYSWAVGGFTGSGENLTNFDFPIPEDVSPGTTYNVVVAVRGISESGVPYEASDSVTLYVGDLSGVLGEGNVISRGLAAVSSLIPPSMRMALKIIGLVILAGVLVFVVSKVLAPISF